MCIRDRIVTVPPAAQSPPQAEALYPASVVSLAVCCTPGVTLTNVLQDTALPSMNRAKSFATAVPPLSLTTVFTSLNRAGMSLLVIVHVAESPAARLIELLSTGAPPFFTQL